MVVNVTKMLYVNCCKKRSGKKEDITLVESIGTERNKIRPDITNTSFYHPETTVASKEKSR